MRPTLRSNAGLTLIEVLIALAILSIALTAVIKSTSQSIRNLIYLENRTTATWVGNNVINSARAGLLKLPEAPANITQETDALGQTWAWQAVVNLTPNKNIKQIDVDVFLKGTTARLAHLTGYLYVANTSP